MSLLRPKNGIEEYKLRAMFDGINGLSGGGDEDSVLEYDAILTHFGALEDLDIVDIGCGNGYFLQKAASENHNTTGVVPSHEEVILLRKKFNLFSFVNIVQGSATETKLESESFDVVICKGVFTLFNDEFQTQKAIDEISRIAKCNAAIFIFGVAHAPEDQRNMLSKVLFAIKNRPISYIFKLALRYLSAFTGMKIIVVPTQTFFISEEKFQTWCLKAGLSITESTPKWFTINQQKYPTPRFNYVLKKTC